eukprot:m.256684 g.256684  ORF g.256684 m.256684 type:complete len:403 (+) comp34582_c0_seq1:61-1269(+)
MPPKKKEDDDVALTGAARFSRIKNTLKMGLVGLPNVGKSSTFNLLCEQAVAAENFPFCTIDPTSNRCKISDDRFDHLVKLIKPVSVQPAWLEITDIAGLVKGASEGAGLGNAFLSNIQAVDGMFHVVRSFDNDEIVHVDDSIDPVRDLETIQSELCKKDLVWWQNAKDQENLAIKKNPKMKLSSTFISVMEKVGAGLENNVGVFAQTWTIPEVQMIRDKLKHLITIKPIVYIINLTKRDYVRKKNKYLMKIMTWIKEHGGGQMIPFSVEFEEEYYALKEDPAAQAAFLEEHKCKSALPKIIKSGYDDLDLQSFFTAGVQEVRAWTIQKGTKAPQAAGVIHQDFERGFIKAEVVGWDDYFTIQTTPGTDKVKAAGKYRQEGKNYVFQDGDVVHFQFNVTSKGK